VLGVFIILSIIAYNTSKFDPDKDIPDPPYIDENGNIDWDKKFQHDTK